MGGLYENVNYTARVMNMAILLVYKANEVGKREVVALEPMLEESKGNNKQLHGGLACDQGMLE